MGLTGLVDAQPAAAVMKTEAARAGGTTQRRPKSAGAASTA